MDLKTHPLTLRYKELTTSGALEHDSAQFALVARFDNLINALLTWQPASKKSALGWLFNKSPASDQKPRGLYIYGDVGRGKTMLMDLFYEFAPVAKKRRVHFHEFMGDVHERIHEAREQLREKSGSKADPIPPVADDLASEAKLLCFDEFSVTDIADAMILGRLFTALFERDVIVVSTSNVAPDNLYKDGLNRGHFLQFIDSLKETIDVVSLDAKTDYRLEKLSNEALFLTPELDDQLGRFERLWREMTGGAESRTAKVKVKGRIISVPEAAAGVARFEFSDLCQNPLGAQDYLAIARNYHTLFIANIPLMDDKMRNEAKRFINLIDALYDTRTKIVATAEAAPESLYIADHGTEQFEFARTASRLIDMQSEEYLGSARNNEPDPKS